MQPSLSASVELLYLSLSPGPHIIPNLGSPNKPPPDLHLLSFPEPWFQNLSSLLSTVIELESLGVYAVKFLASNCYFSVSLREKEALKNISFLKVLTQGYVVTDMRERERERHQCEREILVSCLLYIPQLGIELQPKYVP